MPQAPRPTFPPGLAGAAAQPLTAGTGGGTGRTLPQGQYEGAYPSQGGGTGAARNGARNNREFETQYGPPGGGTLPRLDGPLPAADATSAGPGTGLPSGGPRVLP